MYQVGGLRFCFIIALQLHYCRGFSVDYRHLNEIHENILFPLYCQYFTSCRDIMFQKHFA